MMKFSSNEIALNEDLFYNFRLSMGINDSLVSIYDEEQIETLLINRNKQSFDKTKKTENLIIKKLDLINHDVKLELFPKKLNNYFSCVGILNDDVIQVLFEFYGYIISNKNKEVNMIINETSIFDDPLLLDSHILGFVDYIDLKDETIKEYLSNINEKKNCISKLETEYNEMDYIRILLRISFIKSVCIFKLFGKKIPIYLFIDNDLIMKIETIIVLSNCYISYKLLKNEINDINFKDCELNLNELKWYFNWRSIIKSKIERIKDKDLQYSTAGNKMSRYEQFCDFKDVCRNYSFKNDYKKEFKEKISVKNDYLKETSDENCEKAFESNSENDDLSIVCKDKTESVEISNNNINSNVSSTKNKRKKSKRSNMNLLDTEDYVEKLLQQQTTQLFSC